MDKGKRIVALLYDEDEHKGLLKELHVPRNWLGTQPPAYVLLGGNGDIVVSNDPKQINGWTTYVLKFSYRERAAVYIKTKGGVTMVQKTARLVKRLDSHRILWELSEPILTADSDTSKYVVTVILPQSRAATNDSGTYAFLSDKYGTIMDARYLPESRVHEVSHVESLKALGYVVE